MPDLRGNRLNIDTGAVYGGPLTAAVFVSEQRNPISFIQANEHTAWVSGALPASLTSIAPEAHVSTEQPKDGPRPGAQP